MINSFMISEEGKGNRGTSTNSHYIEVQLISLLCTMKIKKKNIQFTRILNLL